jgi:hypothetical protein
LKFEHRRAYYVGKPLLEGAPCLAAQVFACLTELAGCGLQLHSNAAFVEIVEAVGVVSGRWGGVLGWGSKVSSPPHMILAFLIGANARRVELRWCVGVGCGVTGLFRVL